MHKIGHCRKKVYMVDWNAQNRMNMRKAGKDGLACWKCTRVEPPQAAAVSSRIGCLRKRLRRLSGKEEKHRCFAAAFGGAAEKKEKQFSLTGSDAYVLIAGSPPAGV